MKKYYVSAIIQNQHDQRAWLCPVIDSCLSIRESMDQIDQMRESNVVLSAWVEECDGDNRLLVFLDCYVDILGNVRGIR